MQSFQKIGAIGSVLLIGACSGTDEVVLLDEAGVDLPGVTLSSETPSNEAAPRSALEQLQLLKQKNAEFLAKHEAYLSPEERGLIEQVLGEQGISGDELRFSGRMVILDDVRIDADQILAGFPVAVEKGSALRDLELREPGQTWDPSPTIYARLRTSSGGLCTQGTPGCRFQFRRPKLDHVYIVSDSFPWMKTLLTRVADTIANAADDCLRSPDPAWTTLDVMTESEWLALGVGANFYTATWVQYGPEDQTCPDPGWEPACASFPEYRSAQQVIGWRMAFRSDNGDLFNGDNATSFKIALHEMMHTLGVAHVSSNNLRIPGTQTSTSVPSIMLGVSEQPPTLSEDDIAAIDTLYSPQPGGTCAYSGTFQDTCSQACAKVAHHTSVAGDCCYCNGATRSFKKSPWSSVVFLCQ